MVKAPPRYQNATLEGFLCSSIEQQSLKDYLLAFNAEKGAPNLFLTGNAGTGKTYIAYALQKKIPQSLYIKFSDYVEQIKYNFNAKPDDMYNVWMYRQAPFLILDEYGIECNSDFDRSEMFKLIDYRYNQLLPTMLISNLSVAKIKEVMRVRIADRFFGDCKVFQLTSESWREKYGK